MKKREKKPEKPVIKTLRIIKNVIFAVLLVALVAILITTLTARISGKSPSIFGYAVYRVSSGSMEPTLKVGEVILSKSCEVSELEEGDIITYQGEKGEFQDKIVTHRLIKAPYKDSGEYYVVTKGDKNPSEDSPIKVSSVMGKMVTKLEVLTAVYSFFITPWGLLTLIGLIVLAFFNEILIFIKSLLNLDHEEGDTDVDSIINKYRNEHKEQALPAEDSEDTE